MDSFLTKLYLSFLLLILTIPANADHGAGRSQAARPTVEANEAKDCGARIGQATLRYPGFGFFAYNSYDLKLDFDSDGKGVALDWNFGIDGSLKVRADLEANTTRGKKSETCVASPYSCVNAAAKAEKVLAKAKYRLKNATEAQTEALNCASEKVKQFKNKAEAYLASYKNRRRQANSISRDDDDRGGGVGVYITPNGPTIGIQSGPFVFPLDGSGPTVGF